MTCNQAITRICATLLLTTAAAAMAQERAPLQLEEVVVTAQKRTESLQDAPISLAAFSAEDLEEQGISGLGDLLAKVPNLSIDSHPTSGTTLRLYIRGIGTNDTTITLDPAVGVYQNGIYISRATGLAMDIADLERIEVLRGPQGTLYGRNSTGGTVNLITQKPSVDEQFGYIKASAGSRNLQMLKAVYNLPISERLAVKVGALTSSNDGHTENTGPGEDFGDRSADGYRFDLLWDIGEQSSLMLSYDYAELDFANYVPQSMRPSTNNGGQADQVRAGANANSFHSDQRVDKLATTAPLLSSPNEIAGWGLHFTTDIGGAEFRSITAYRSLDSENYIDLGGGAGSEDYRLDTGAYTFRSPAGGSLPASVPVLEHEQFSQEFQLLGAIFDGRIEYIAGLYYFDEKAEEDALQEKHVLSGQIGGPNSPTYLVSTNSAFVSLDAKATALFGQFTWRPDMLDDRLGITLGYRHSEDSKKARKFSRSRALTDTALVTTQIADNSFDSTGDKDFADDSFTLILSFDASDDINLYAKVAEAYKGGGFNIREPDETIYTNGFDEENVIAYEIGIKSELFDRRLRLNADVFYSLSENTQLSFALGGAAETRVLNVGESTLKGFEMDATWLVMQGLTATLNYAYLDGEITSAVDESGVDRKDDFVLGNTPRHTANLNANWQVGQWDFGTLEVSAGYSFVDDKTGAAAASAFERHGGIDSYGLWSGRIALRDIPLWGSSTADIALWGKNLTDEDYVVTALGVLPHSNRAVFWGDPRTVGMDLKVSF